VNFSTETSPLINDIDFCFSYSFLSSTAKIDHDVCDRRWRPPREKWRQIWWESASVGRCGRSEHLPRYGTDLDFSRN